MPHLTANGVSLAYDDVGPRDAAHCVVLVHGFTSNRTENWRRVGWLAAFERRRMRAIAYDVRGHGESDKPHDTDAYDTAILAADLFAIMDALDVRTAVVMGYSMGARLALAAALSQPERVEALILGGIGGRIFEAPPTGTPLADAMEATSVEAIADPLLRSFRQFADEQGEDRQALAACARVRRSALVPDMLRGLRCPTLVVAGARDALAGDPEELAATIPGGRAVVVPACDHFSTIAHVLYKAAVFDFLDEMPM